MNRGDGDSGGHAGEGATAGDAGLDAATDAGNWTGIDVADCEERPEGDCTGMLNYYTSNDGFDGTPALSECSRFVHPDGCGRVEFAFDSNGCADAVEQGFEDVEELRDCMMDVFVPGRFTCLEGMTLTVLESCFIE